MIDGQPRRLRPSFDALVRAEQELGPLFALVERAGEGQLRLAEIAALFWHCLAEPAGLTRSAVGEAVVAIGLAEAANGSAVEVIVPYTRVQSLVSFAEPQITPVQPEIFTDVQ